MQLIWFISPVFIYGADILTCFRFISPVEGFWPWVGILNLFYYILLYYIITYAGNEILYSFNVLMPSVGYNSQCYIFIFPHFVTLLYYSS